VKEGSGNWHLSPKGPHWGNWGEGFSFTVKDSKKQLCKQSISLHGSDGKLDGELLYWDLCKICKTCQGRLWK
jgi:hypothetical protein